MKIYKKTIFIIIFIKVIIIANLVEAKVQFKNDRLAVNGEPFFIYGCWGTPNKDYETFRRRHFNTAFIKWRYIVEEGPKAAKAGLMVIPFVPTKFWDYKMIEIVKAIANQDWLLAWNIGDDLHKKRDLKKVFKVRNTIYKFDKYRRPIMFDADRRHEIFAKNADMWGAYDYPLVKNKIDALSKIDNDGLQGYGEWLNRMRLLGKPNGFFWTWTQCHVQRWYSRKYLGATDKDLHRPSLFPDGDHLRLIAAHAVSAGCLGILWYIYEYFQDSHNGRDRYARAAIIGCELDVIGTFIASGKIGENLKTENMSVRATPIDFPGGRLICLVKTGDGYQYQPDRAEVANLDISQFGNGDKVFQINYDLKELSGAKVSFYLTSWLLITRNQYIIDKVRKTHKSVLPDMARFAVEELDARLVKVKPIFRKLRKDSSSVQQAYKQLESARNHLELKNWSKAGKAAEDGLTTLRSAQYRICIEEWKANNKQNLRYTDFYLLPKVEVSK
jgi:hypothetical protein